MNPYKIKKKVTYFKDTMAQSKHSHPKREKQNNKEESHQSNIETQQVKHYIL
jgi:hypothetical protein